MNRMKFLKTARQSFAVILMIIVLWNVVSCGKPTENGDTPLQSQPVDTNPIGQPMIDPVSEATYHRALEHLKAEEYVEAHALFQTISGYRDVDVYLMRFSWRTKSRSEVDLTLPGKAVNRYDYTYDEYGRILTENYRNYNATIVDKETYEYDENGHLIRRGHSYNYEDWIYQTWEYDSHGSLVYEKTSNGTSRYAYQYGENGLVLSKTLRIGGSAYPSRKEEYEYDAQGRVTKVTSYSGKLQNREFTFEKKGFRTISYDSFGNISHINTGGSYYERYEYDANNRLIREEVHWGDPKADYVITYLYDSDGRLLQEEKTVKNGSHNIQKNMYDAQGRKIYSESRSRAWNSTNENVNKTYWTYSEDGFIHRNSYRGETLHEQSTYQLNDQGKIIYERIYREEYFYETTREYDEHGNLMREAIKRESGVDGYSSCDVVVIYSEYRLYYDPTIVPKQEIPEVKRYPFGAIP